MEIFCKGNTKDGLTKTEIKTALERSLSGRSLNSVLLIVPDYSRFHSNGGLITNIYYHMLQKN